MSKSVVTGSCHCGSVAFEVELDREAGFTHCNCSICHKLTFVGHRVKPDAFKLLKGKEDLQDYQFNTKRVHHYFCKNCGIHTFAQANFDNANGELYVVNTACLDNVDLSGTKVTGLDGKSNTWKNIKNYTFEYAII